MEPWRARLEAGDNEGAWTLFLARYHRLIGATIGRCTADAEDALDAFAHVCDRLAYDDLARLRKFHESPEHRAKFSTWLVVVVRNLAIDWRRSCEGRPRHLPPAGLTPLRKRIYELVLVGRTSHVEAYEIVRAEGNEELSYPEFVREIASTFRAVDSRRWTNLALLHGSATDMASEAEQASDHVERAEERDRLAKALATLTEQEREAIRLFVVEERSAAEVATAVGWAGAKTVYNRVQRALASMRAQFGIGPPR